MKTEDKIQILNLIKNEIKDTEQNKLNVLTFYDLYQLLNKCVNKLNLELIENSKRLNKCTCLHPQVNCFSGLCTYCNRIIEKNITTNDL